MARALIVGCGCRGRALAGALAAEGHAVRGTSRSERSLTTIAGAGAEAVTADPYRLGTITTQLEGVTVICWLLGTAAGEPEAVQALHGPRLASALEAIVDTPVRGMVYEAAGSVRSGVLERGVAICAQAAATHRMPVELLRAEPERHHEWLDEAAAAVGRVLAA